MRGQSAAKLLGVRARPFGDPIVLLPLATVPHVCFDDDRAPLHRIGPAKPERSEAFSAAGAPSSDNVLRRNGRCYFASPRMHAGILFCSKQALAGRTLTEPLDGSTHGHGFEPKNAGFAVR